MTRGQGEQTIPNSLLFSDDFSVVAAAHELKAPLALIRQLALMVSAGASPADTQRMAAQIGLTSERALRLTSDLTRSTRLEDALFELEPINPVALCEDIVHELTPLFGAHGKVIAMRPRQHSLLAVANRDLLGRVIANFSDNALHYASPEGRVELSARKVGTDYIRIGVRDYGPALRSSLWQNLQTRLDTPTSVDARPQSSGLGLYLAGLFAETMNGRIGAIRHRDGASFYIDLQSSSQLQLL